MVGIDGIAAPALSRFLMDKYRIVINAVVGGTYPNQVFSYEGLRVTPNVYTTTEEIDTFVTAMLDAAPRPTAFTACTRMKYAVPLARPPMTNGLEMAVGERGVQVAPPSREYS